MEQFIYAPVVIPTICRYNTFKPCIDSLSRCTDADKTELYIGLDYPAKESHWEGYRKICDYVQDIKGFKSVYIFKREYNYGQGKNMEDLLKHVKEKYDRYIVSEDDNVFSPNFLEYINYGLEKYRDHPDVIAICGFNYPFSYMENIIGYEKNAFPITAFTAWGVGLWLIKNLSILSIKIRQRKLFIHGKWYENCGNMICMQRFIGFCLDMKEHILT